MDQHSPTLPFQNGSRKVQVAARGNRTAAARRARPWAPPAFSDCPARPSARARSQLRTQGRTVRPSSGAKLGALEEVGEGERARRGPLQRLLLTHSRDSSPGQPTRQLGYTKRGPLRGLEVSGRGGRCWPAFGARSNEGAVCAAETGGARPGGPRTVDRVLTYRSGSPASDRPRSGPPGGEARSGPRSGPLCAPSPPSVSGGQGGDLASPMPHTGGRMPAAPASQKTWPPRQGGTAAAVRFAFSRVRARAARRGPAGPDI